MQGPKLFPINKKASICTERDIHLIFIAKELQTEPPRPSIHSFPGMHLHAIAPIDKHCSFACIKET